MRLGRTLRLRWKRVATLNYRGLWELRAVSEGGIGGVFTTFILFRPKRGDGTEHRFTVFTLPLPRNTLTF